MINVKSKLGPSKRLEAVLSGAASYHDAPDWLKSWASKSIYDKACDIIRESDQEKRRNLLTLIPASYRGEVEAEVKRLWPIRDRIRRARHGNSIHLPS